MSNVPHHNGIAHLRPHIRFHWGTTDATWDLWCSVKNDGALVRYCSLLQTTFLRADQFIPGQIPFSDVECLSIVEVDPVAVGEVAAPPQPLPELFNLGPPPRHDPRQPPTSVQRMGFEFGTVSPRSPSPPFIRGTALKIFSLLR